MKSKLYFTETSDQPLISQLTQLTCLTCDGDLVSKKERDSLVQLNYAQRINGGWNLITPLGIEYLEEGGFIEP